MDKRDGHDAPDVADELYLLPPQAFTHARDEQVAAAKNRGDQEQAKALARCKRPTVGGWLVNLVALRRPDLVDELIKLGETIRHAQGNVAPAQLRDLSTQRRRQLDLVLAQSQSLATQAGAPAPTRQQISEAEATFAAAMADADAARLVRSGRVVKALSYSGFGQAGEASGDTVWIDGAGSAVTRPTIRTDVDQHEVPRSTAPAEDAEQLAEARAAAARARVADARSALDHATRAEQDTLDQVATITAQITVLKEQLAGIEATARSARQARLAAERELASAERRLARLT